uniref:Uncharacterized protein n=1 Tax=Solanum tuberosum TaxID=4113 RepID=M1CB85_SOLTU
MTRPRNSISRRQFQLLETTTTAPNDAFSVRIHGRFTSWTRESVLCDLLSSSPQRPYPHLISQQQQASTRPTPFLFRNGAFFRRKGVFSLNGEGFFILNLNLKLGLGLSDFSICFPQQFGTLEIAYIYSLLPHYMGVEKEVKKKG